MNFDTALISKTGGRKENEDYCQYILLPQAACWILADGLGSHGGGAVASQTAVETIMEFFQVEPEITAAALLRYISAAQNTIIKQQQKAISLSSMRTTMVLLTSDGYCANWAYVGDSRLYQFRQGRIIYQSRDHSVPQALVDSGRLKLEEIRQHEDRNRILKALGDEKEPHPSLPGNPIELQTEDAFLLCSDGFWEYVYETEMEVDLAKSQNPEEWIKRMEARLLQRADKNNDNYSVIAVLVR